MGNWYRSQLQLFAQESEINADLNDTRLSSDVDQTKTVCWFFNMGYNTGVHLVAFTQGIMETGKRLGVSVCDVTVSFNLVGDIARCVESIK